MKITPEIVDAMAALARLEIPQARKTPLAADMEKIVGLMDELQGLALPCSPPDAATAREPVWREDALSPSAPRGALLSAAPETDGTHLIVPKIME